MARIIGNSGPGINSTNSGSGIPPRRCPFAHLTVISDEAGDDIRIPATDLFPKFSQVFQGVFVQAVGGSAEIYTTLIEPGLAMNPQQDGSHWISAASISDGTITKIDNLTTCLRIVFSAKGTVVYVAGV
jgi:hypothetical protein